MNDLLRHYRPPSQYIVDGSTLREELIHAKVIRPNPTYEKPDSSPFVAAIGVPVLRLDDAARRAAAITNEREHFNGRFTYLPQLSAVGSGSIDRTRGTCR